MIWEAMKSMWYHCNDPRRPSWYKDAILRLSYFSDGNPHSWKDGLYIDTGRCHTCTSAVNGTDNHDFHRSISQPYGKDYTVSSFGMQYDSEDPGGTIATRGLIQYEDIILSVIIEILSLEIPFLWRNKALDLITICSNPSDTSFICFRAYSFPVQMCAVIYVGIFISKLLQTEIYSSAVALDVYCTIQ